MKGNIVTQMSEAGSIYTNREVFSARATKETICWYPFKHLYVKRHCTSKTDFLESPSNILATFHFFRLSMTTSQGKYQFSFNHLSQLLMDSISTLLGNYLGTCHIVDFWTNFTLFREDFNSPPHNCFHCH